MQKLYERLSKFGGRVGWVHLVLGVGTNSAKAIHNLLQNCHVGPQLEIPSKLKCFMWRPLRDSLLTRTAPNKLVDIISPICILCSTMWLLIIYSPFVRFPFPFGTICCHQSLSPVAVIPPISCSCLRLQAIIDDWELCVLCLYGKKM